MQIMAKNLHQAPENVHVLTTNRRVYDRMAAANDPLCRPATDEELANPLATVDGPGWLGQSIKGKHVLCLAAGGGRQSSLYAAAGAQVTVVDISPAMLERDRQVAVERGYSLRILETSMDDLSGIATADVDIVIHPVSTCYLPKIQPVFVEVARVLRNNGIYVSQHKQPVSLQCDVDPSSDGEYHIKHRYYRDTPVPAPPEPTANAKRLRESGAIEYLHRWEEIIGGMCRAGFVIEDLTEPSHIKKDCAFGSFAHRASMIAPYVRIKARRRGEDIAGPQTTKIWTPSE